MKTKSAMKQSLYRRCIGFSILILLPFAPVIAQTKTRVRVITVANQSLTDFVLNSEPFAEKRGKEVLIKVFSVTTDIVSPFAEETDEVDVFLYVATTGYGEVGTKAKKTHLYKIGPFFAPRLINWVKFPSKPDEFLLFNYLTKLKNYGSLAITANTLIFTEGKPINK